MSFEKYDARREELIHEQTAKELAVKEEAAKLHKQGQILHAECVALTQAGKFREADDAAKESRALKAESVRLINVVLPGIKTKTMEIAEGRLPELQALHVTCINEMNQLRANAAEKVQNEYMLARAAFDNYVAVLADRKLIRLAGELSRAARVARRPADETVNALLATVNPPVAA